MAFLHRLPNNVAAPFDVLLGGSSSSGPHCWLTGHLSSAAHMQALLHCPPASACTQFNLEQCCDGGVLPELSPCWLSTSASYFWIRPKPDLWFRMRWEQTHPQILGTESWGRWWADLHVRTSRLRGVKWLVQSLQESLAEWDKKSWMLVLHLIFFLYTMMLSEIKWGSYPTKSKNSTSSLLFSGSGRVSGSCLVVLIFLSFETGLSCPIIFDTQESGRDGRPWGL